MCLAALPLDADRTMTGTPDTPTCLSNFHFVLTTAATRRFSEGSGLRHTHGAHAAGGSRSLSSSGLWFLASGAELQILLLLCQFIPNGIWVLQFKVDIAVVFVNAHGITNIEGLGHGRGGGSV